MIGFSGVVLLAVVAVFVMSRRSDAPQPVATPPVVLEMIPITSDGRSAEATISADGRYVAYVTQDERGRHALGYTQVSTGSAVVVVPAEDDVFLFDPVFSPDGE